MSNDFNDSLDGVFGVPTDRPASEPRPAAAAYLAKVAEQPSFFQKCGRCNGTGQTPWGVCFRCKGAKGKTFKTSPETREANRTKAAERKVAREAGFAAEALAAFEAKYPPVFAWLKAETAKPQPFDFAVKMIAAIAEWGSLTDKQLDACARLADRDAGRAAKRAAAVADAPAVDCSVIEQAFATARQKAARPGQKGIMVKPLKLAAGPAKTDIAVKVTPGSVGSQWEGQLFFKSIDGDRKLGYVKGGKFIRQFFCTEAEAAAVVKMASEPREALIAFAKAWSSCGVCGRGLLNDESIERGIGPICMQKFGW